MAPAVHLTAGALWLRLERDVAPRWI